MNPLISANSSLFLSLIQLQPLCSRLLNSLHDANCDSKGRQLQEQTLWNEVKKITAIKDNAILTYMIGYYHTILFQTSTISHCDDLFHYHVLIRLGDLNRYLDRLDVAEYYYCNARNSFPSLGHAYNQLGLLTKPKNHYKCCYYYARAAKSVDRPLTTVADSNLRMAVSKYNCEILNHILNNEACIELGPEDRNETLPRTALEWFYVMVVALYADNVRPIAKLFLSYLNQHFATQRASKVIENVKTTTTYCDHDSYMLLASLDILLDWLKLGSQGKRLCSTLGSELRLIKSCLQSTINTFKNDAIQQSSSLSGSNISPIVDKVSPRGSINVSNSTRQDSCFTIDSNCSIQFNNTKLPALPHDYVLRGFSLLNDLHQKLTFQTGSNFITSLDGSMQSSKEGCQRQRFIESEQLLQFLLRIKHKMNAFGPLLKGRTRNVALESILSNMNAD